MTTPDNAQPEALRLAANLRRMNMLTINCMELERAANELEKAHTEIDRLRALAATCYAGLGGECDLPVIWLDALNDAASGEPFDTEGLLPYTSAIRAELVAQTNRAAEAEQQVVALNRRLDMSNAMKTDAEHQLAWRRLAQLSARQDAPDGWCLVPREPTLEMLVASDKTWLEFSDSQDMVLCSATAYRAMLQAAPPPPEREPLTELQKQALAVYLPPFQFSHGYVFDSAGRMVADEGRERELDQLASTVGVRIRGWGHLGKLKNGAEVQDTLGELVVTALNAFWKQHGIGATND